MAFSEEILGIECQSMNSDVTKHEPEELRTNVESTIEEPRQEENTIRYASEDVQQLSHAQLKSKGRMSSKR